MGEFELISDKIRNAMERANLSYGELSALTGISKSSLYRYASGFTPKIPLNRLGKKVPMLNSKKPPLRVKRRRLIHSSQLRPHSCGSSTSGQAEDR